MLKDFKRPGFKSYFMRFPTPVYRELIKMAEKEHRSLAQEIVHLLEWALKHKKLD